MPMISGIKRSCLLEMSLSVFNFLAQNRIIAIGKIEAKTSEINSKTTNLYKSKTPFSKESTIHINKNNGIVIMGGFVIAEIISAIFTLFIQLFIVYLN